MIKCKHIINIANRCCCIRRKAGPGRRPIPIGFYPSPGGIETAVKSSKWPEHEGKLYPLSCHPSNRFRLFNIRPKSIRKESQRARKRERVPFGSCFNISTFSYKVPRLFHFQGLLRWNETVMIDSLPGSNTGEESVMATWVGIGAEIEMKRGDNRAIKTSLFASESQNQDGEGSKTE